MENLSPRDADAVRPLDLEIEGDRVLRIRWANGEESVLPLPFLRHRCPCATCRAERDAGSGPPQATRVASAELVGNYALKITWADGHNAGIYDFQYLRRLADELGASPSGC